MLMRSYNLKIPASLYHMVVTDKVKMSLFFKKDFTEENKKRFGQKRYGGVMILSKSERRGLNRGEVENRGLFYEPFISLIDQLALL